MLKQILIITLITAVVVYFAHQFGAVLHGLAIFQVWLAHKIDLLAPQASWMPFFSNLITLVIIPLIIGLIPAFVYWLIEKREMPKLKETVIILWIILLLVFAFNK